MTSSVTSGRKCPGPHPVDVERPAEMVDLVLEDPRVPATCVDGDRLSVVVERLHVDGAGARHDSLKPFDAETAFEEIDHLRAERQPRVDDDVERNRRALGRFDL